MGVPTVSIAAVSSPRSDALSSLNIVFSEAVNGFNLADLTLTRSGSGNLLTGSQTLTTSNNITFSLNGLATITRQRGSYMLTLTAAGSGIVSVSTGQALVTGATRNWTMQVLAWDGAVNCLRSAHFLHQNVLSTEVGGALWPLDISTLTNSGGEYLVTLTAAFPPTQDYTANDWVTIEGQSGATGAAGFWQIAGVGANSFRLVGSTWVNNGAGGKAYRWHVGRWDAIGTFSLSGASKRGSQLGNNSFFDTNFYVPHNLAVNIKKAPPVDATHGVLQGAAYGGLNKVRFKVPAHGLSTGNVVEVAGVRDVNGSEIARGVWVVTRIDADNFDLDGSVWPGGTYSASTGIYQLHANAVSNRAYLLSGDANNGGATALTTVASTSASYRGYRQGLDDYRAWLEAHTDARPGYYISGSAVATPHAVLERGLLAGYPFALTPMD